MDKEKVKSSLLGFIVGDALGVPFEFFTRQKMKQTTATGMVGGGSWNQPIGTWSDDTSMVLATMDCLSQGYTIPRLGGNFHSWLYLGEYTPHGEVFDCGIQTKVGINRINSLIEDGSSITPMSPGKDVTKNGNGSLMRILPFGFYLSNHRVEERWRIVNEVSALTHPHILSSIGCFIYSELVLELMTCPEKIDALKTVIDRVNEFLGSRTSQTDLEYYDRILKNDIRILPESEIKTTPFVVYSLEAVLWCFLHGNDYRGSVLTSVNLGGDTDTIAALVGGLCGLKYGITSIPSEWIGVLAKKEYILKSIDRFVEKLE